jgi:tyrosyl-tRNA synthetase
MRLIQQNAVEINGKPVTGDIAMIKVDDGSIIKVGKRRYLKVVRKP